MYCEDVIRYMLGDEYYKMIVNEMLERQNGH